MQLYLFCGFFGSGKTTTVTEMAKYLVETKNEKIMMIVNDIGDVGIDAQLMRRLQTDVYELFGGCICGQLGNLVNLLLGIGEKYIVDTVIIEASGIAEPARFIDTIEKFVPDGTDVKVITLADADRWEELYQVMDGLITSQVNSADLVVINKADAVDENVLAKVAADIEDIKPGVKTITISAFNPGEVHQVAEVIRDAR
ncbi:MAG: GTP-binding protein [Desulfitobacteriaceae bacterium]|nr:GTP-binding protein [Desulfitobacteriaceae bacterium]